MHVKPDLTVSDAYQPSQTSAQSSHYKQYIIFSFEQYRVPGRSLDASNRILQSGLVVGGLHLI